MEVKCFQCGEALFKRFHNSHRAHTPLGGTVGIKLESQGVTLFPRYPFCYAKNVVTNIKKLFE